MAAVSHCPSTDHLRRYACGQVNEDDGSEVFAHIQTCDTCQSELETISDSYDDSLIENLKQIDHHDSLQQERQYPVAMARALAALAESHQAGSDPGNESIDFPQTIGEYEIQGILGRGGMGTVYLARHTKLGRDVALKILSPHRLIDDRIRRRFESEMRSIGRLSHPGMVTAHDAREIDGVAVLVTEYIQGWDLREVVDRNGPLRLADACEIVRQVAVTLQYLNEQGFVHRDIKPSNIMLGHTGEVKLLDLGLARLMDREHDHVDAASLDLTAAGQTMGTADYIAPEQVQDSRSADIGSDLYSLGCTLMHLLTGEPPFSGSDYPTVFAKMTAHVSADPPRLVDRLPETPAKLAKLVDSMLAKRRINRPVSPSEVAGRLRPFVGGANLENLAVTTAEQIKLDSSHQVEAASPPRQYSVSRRGRFPVTVALASGFVGVLLGFAAGMFIRIRQPDGTEITLEVPSESVVSVEPELDGSGLQKPAQSDLGVVSPGPYTAPSNPPPIASVQGDAYRLNGAIDWAKVPLLASQFETVTQAVRALNGPLNFSVLVDTDTIDAEDLSSATEALIHSGKPDGLVVVGKYIWYPLDEGINAPITQKHQGETYALVESTPNNCIGWLEMEKQIRGIDHSQDDRLLLELSDELGRRMTLVTGANLGKQLAVILSQRIIVAPRIHSKISKQLAITGIVDPQHRKQLIGLFSKVLKEQQAHDDLERSTKTKNNLRQIGLAFHNYESVHGAFPPSAGLVRMAGAGLVRMADNQIDGKKTHPVSWRVLILPWLDQQKLYDRYRFDQPWDSEENLKLVQEIPDVFISPFAPKNGPIGHTHYLGFATDDGALGKTQGFKFWEFTDGTSRTLLVADTKRSVPWTQPMDLTDPERKVVPNGKRLHFVTCDGAVHAVPLESKQDYEQLAKWLTRNGGEVIEQVP